MALLSFEHVVKSYGDGRELTPVLRDVSFEVSCGDVVGLWGMRRSGKTTVLRLAAAVFTLYRWRLRHHVIQELLACAGIAIGVALCFGVLVANTSIVGSARQLIGGVTGSAELKLSARSEAGMPESVARRAERLPGVWHAASVLRADATVVSQEGRSSVQLVGVTASVIGLHSAATRNFSSAAPLLGGGIGLPSGVASAVSVHARESVRLLISGVQRNATVATVLGSEMVGAVAEGPVAIASMPVAQQLAGRPSRVSEVLIEARRGREREVATELRRLSGGELEVTGADHEVALLANAGSVSVPASASCSRTASSMRCHAS